MADKQMNETLDQADDLIAKMDELFAGNEPSAVMIALIQMMAEMGTRGYFDYSKYEFMGRVHAHLSEAYDDTLEDQAKKETVQ